MDRAAFEAELAREGRQVVCVTMPPNKLNPEHAHDFDARVMVVEGEMTVAFADRTITCRSGDSFMVQPGQRHSEQAGPQGATYVAGRRTTA